MTRSGVQSSPAAPGLNPYCEFASYGKHIKQPAAWVCCGSCFGVMVVRAYLELAFGFIAGFGMRGLEVALSGVPFTAIPSRIYADRARS